MRFSVLASGSGGNAVYIEANKTGILIDSGISCKELLKRLEIINVDPGKINGLFITHEHGDHVKGVGPVARRLGIPVFINRPTYEQCAGTLGNISEIVPIRTGQTVAVGSLKVETFSKCHDAADPMGMVVSYGGLRFGLATDLGRSTRLVEERLKGCRALVLEFNHDVELLEKGSYPLFLKRRIRGPEGHLSNDQAGELVRALAHDGLRLVVPAHMSRENNRPEFAFREASQVLASCVPVGSKVELSLQEDPMPLQELG